MATHAGNKADVYIVTGTGTAFTAEACTLVSGTTYQINNTAKRYWDKTTAVTVYDGGVAVDASAYELVYAGGKIVLATAPGGAVTVTGASLAIAQYAQAHKWSLDTHSNLVDATTFGSTWMSHAKVNLSATATIERFFNVDYYLTTGITNKYVVVLYTDQSATTAYRFIGAIDGNGIVSDTNQLISESVTFQADGWVDYAADA